MTKHWRSLLFTLFLVGFSITAPIVVLYTAGYRYNFLINKVVKTGVLSISSYPKGADIYIDNKLQSKRTPLVIDNLVPGKHIVKITKDNYTTWQKNLEVISNKTVFASNVVLFLNERTKKIDQWETLTSKLNSKGDVVYVKQNEKMIELWVKLLDKPEKLILRNTYDIQQIPHIQWSPNGKYVFLYIENQKTATIIQTKTNEINEVPFDKQTKFVWDLNSENFYTIKNKKISIHNPLNNETTLLNFSAENLISYKDSFIGIQSSNNHTAVSIIDTDGFSSIITYLDIGDYSFIDSPDQFIMLRNNSTNKIMLIDPNNINDPLYFTANAITWDWNYDKSKLLFSDGLDIAVYYINNNTFETVTRLSTYIKKLSWYPHGNSIIFQTKLALTSLEIDNRDTQNNNKLFDDEIDDYWIDKEGKNIYITKSNNETTEFLVRQLQK